MVAHRRIDPDGGLLREIIDVRRRVTHVETRPSGVMATREMFIVTDPETGVKTIMGKLPDGSTGFQPFIGDIVPPPVATAPTASAQPGTITVTWDGTFVAGAEQPADFEHLNVIGHKIVTGTTVLSLEVGSIRLANESVIVNTDIISYGEQWQFSFESEDYNGNISVRSDRTPILDVISYVDDSLVGEALSDLAAATQTAQEAADTAQGAATAAQGDADAAAAAALAANNLAESKGKVLIQSTAPAVADQLAQNLWIDTTGGTNTPKRWNGTTWEVVTDKVAVDAASAAATAQGRADQAFNSATSAATAAGNAQTSADSKNKIWYQTTAPAGTGHKAGDTWFDTDDGNRVYIWTGAAWTDHRDTGIAAAQTAANTALTSANGKNKNYYQTTMPSGGTYILGDTWFDTDDGNKIYVHNGTTFVAAPLGTNAIANLAITDAQIAAATISSAKIANLDAAKITSGTIDANRIGANTINVTKLAVSDFTNLATLDEVNGVNVSSFGQTQIVGGYAKLVTDSGTFLMFTDRRGPVPFKVGDRLYYEFTAKATAATTATFTVYTYDALDGNTSVTSGNLNIGTTDTLIKGELIVSNIRPNAVQFVLGLSGVANKGIQVKGIRVYKKLGGELVVDGSITTNHMTSGTIDASVLTAGSITAPKIAAKAITADKLVITSSDNLVVGGDMALSAASWGKNATITAQPTGGRGSMAALRFTGTASAQASTNIANRVTVEPDNRFRCSIFVKSSSALAVDRVRLMIRCFTSATTSTDVIGVYNTAPLVANTWTQVKGVSYALPADTREVEFYLYVTNPDTTTTTDIDYVSVTRAADGTLVVDGAITATKLESDLILSTKIIAGDPNGTHAEMTPQGFRVFAASTAATGGPPTEAVRLGVASTDDYFAITKSDGKYAASISQDGVGSFSELYAKKLYHDGKELTTLLDARPRGVVAAAYRYSDSLYNAVSGGAFLPYLRLEAELEPNRMYKIWTSSIKGSMDSGTAMRINIRYAVNVLADAYNSSDLTYENVSNGENSVTMQELFAFGGTVKKTISFIILFGTIAGGGQCGIRSTLANPVRLVVEDLGMPTGGIGNGAHLDGTAPPPTPTNTYVKQYGCSNSMNYQGSNAQYNFDTGRMYQGLSPAGYGNLKSIGLFGNMTTDLSGATINYIRVYFNFAHWYYNSGGTARIGLHGHTGIPGTFSHAGVVVTSGGWPKPGARWVDIPAAYWDGFKSGAYRGVSLEGDSTYGTYGYADRPTIEISYTK